MYSVGLVHSGLLHLGEPKLKLYRDINGVLKGDGLCCYLKVESVQLALQILDGSDFRGHRVNVERVCLKNAQGVLVWMKVLSITSEAVSTGSF